MLPRKWIGVGIPDHSAVGPVGGRLGAASGPAAFQKVFTRLRGQVPLDQTRVDWITVSSLTGTTEQNHRATIEQLTPQLMRAPLSLIIGGSHDHGFTHLEAILRAYRHKLGRAPRLGCINLDAHLDLRPCTPEITSGSPFFLAIENKTLRPEDLVEFGIQVQSNAPELWNYANDKGIPIVGFEDLRDQRADVVGRFEAVLQSLSARCDAVIISLDLDCIHQASAPGVSAPQADGFTTSEIFGMLRAAGRDPKVCSLGIFELNPAHDLEQQTARVAATAAYQFLATALGQN